MANPVTTAEELDALLKGWETDLTQVRANISELKQTLAYQLLSTHGTPGGRTLTGRTLELLPPAFEALRRMDANWAKLQTFVSDQRTAYGKLPRWGQKQAVEEIAARFKADSIIMEVREIPLRERTATSGDKVTVKSSPEKLKQQINADFVKANGPLHDVDDKWSSLNPQLSRARAKVQDLERRFDTAKIVDSTELANLVKRFNGFDTKYKTDPLGCPADIEASLRSYMTAAEGRLQAEEERIRREQEAVATKLQTAKDKLDVLKASRVRALELYQTAKVEIDNPEAYGLAAPGSVKRLSEWLEVLDKALAEGRYSSVSDGVNDWYIEFNDLNRSIAGVIDANERITTRRKDLIRRFAQARAQYDAHKAQIGESKSLAKFAELAEAALNGKIKLDEAERAVESYEVKLGELVLRLQSK